MDDNEVMAACFGAFWGASITILAVVTVSTFTVGAAKYLSFGIGNATGIAALMFGPAVYELYKGIHESTEADPA